MHAVSQNGKRRATLERYEPETRIAVVRTPGGMQEIKPYHFDGVAWIPLWCPVAPEFAASAFSKDNLCVLIDIDRISPKLLSLRFPLHLEV